MQTELTPKQQASELIKQANNILIITGREPNNDQLSAAVAMQRALNKLQKQAGIVISDRLPKSSELYDTKIISKEIQGIRDFIVNVNMHSVVVDKLKYDVEDENLKITITPLNGNIESKDVSFENGPFKFDLIIALGVPQITKLDKIVEQNPTIFDGLHLINIDYHRINENYGSVNYVDQNSSSVCEMLVSLFESLEQGMIDESISTALFTGITSSTHNFTTADTTAKAMTVAAQMLAAGAKHQQIVKVMKGQSKKEYAKTENKPEPMPIQKEGTNSIKEAIAKAQEESKKSSSKESSSKESKTDTVQKEGSKKKTKSGLKGNFKKKVSSQDHSKEKLNQTQPDDFIASAESSVDDLEPAK